MSLFADTSDRTRRRIPGVAMVLAFFNPLVGMLYVGRPLRAVLYIGAFILVQGSVFLLARGGYWPAGVSWIAVTLLVNGVFMADAYRIARQHQGSFTGGWYTRWYGLAAAAAAFVGLALSFRAFVFEPFRQPSGSMMPTLVEGDQFWVSKRAYRDNEPQRGDVIVFLVPGSDVFYVKRIIGLPGDVIDYDANSRRLTVNGEPMALELVGAFEGDGGYLLAREDLLGVEHGVLHMRSPSGGGRYNVPPEHYFVMGDNRDNSMDSRFREIGFIPAGNIRGKVALIWWNTEQPTRAGIVPE